MNNISLIFNVVFALVLAICVLDLIIILFDEKRYEKARDANMVEQAEIIRLQLSRKKNLAERGTSISTNEQKERLIYRAIGY